MATIRATKRNEKNNVRYRFRMGNFYLTNKDLENVLQEFKSIELKFAKTFQEKDIKLATELFKEKVNPEFLNKVTFGGSCDTRRI